MFQALGQMLHRHYLRKPRDGIGFGHREVSWHRSWYYDAGASVLAPWTLLSCCTSACLKGTRKTPSFHYHFPHMPQIAVLSTSCLVPTPGHLWGCWPGHCFGSMCCSCCPIQSSPGIGDSQPLLAPRSPLQNKIPDATSIA